MEGSVRELEGRRLGCCERENTRRRRLQKMRDISISGTVTLMLPSSSNAVAMTVAAMKMKMNTNSSQPPFRLRPWINSCLGCKIDLIHISLANIYVNSLIGPDTVSYIGFLIFLP